MSLVLILVGLVVLLITAPPSQAIVILPALILIPIAKIVAVIVGGLSLPTLGISTLIGKMWRKSLWLSIGVGIVVLAVVGVGAALALKHFYPAAHLF